MSWLIVGGRFYVDFDVWKFLVVVGGMVGGYRRGKVRWGILLGF